MTYPLQYLHSVFHPILTSPLPAVPPAPPATRPHFGPASAQSAAAFSEVHSDKFSENIRSDSQPQSRSGRNQWVKRGYSFKKDTVMVLNPASR